MFWILLVVLAVLWIVGFAVRGHSGGHNESTAWDQLCSGTTSEQDTAVQPTHALLETTMRDFSEGATEIADGIAARLIHGLHDEWLRDHGLEFIEDDGLPHARRPWATLARHCIPPYTNAAIPALTLLAAVAWRQGDLPTARHALKQALTAHPEYDLAEAINGAINSGVAATSLLPIARTAKVRRPVGVLVLVFIRDCVGLDVHGTLRSHQGDAHLPFRAGAVVLSTDTEIRTIPRGLSGIDLARGVQRPELSAGYVLVVGPERVPTAG